MRKENLTDLVNIVPSLKNKYSIVPFAVAAQGEPVRNALMDTLLLNKLMNPLLDTPRLASVLVVPHGFPLSRAFFSFNVTLGE